MLFRSLQAGAVDDFGLLDYGVAWSVADGEPRYLSRRPDPATSALQPPPRSAEFAHLLALEAEGAEPDQLVTWFAWADDMGSDGKPRRTSGDLFFAEVRRFDEIFREGEGGNQQQGNQGGSGGDEAANLLELQREISLAIWKLRAQPPRSNSFQEDVTVVLDSQAEARARLEALADQLSDPALQTARAEADRHMQRVEDGLDISREQSSSEPLAMAWTSSQGAYQALLRMQPDSTQVNRQRGAQGSQAGGRGNQRQQIGRAHV